MTKPETKAYITWERLALSLLGLLISTVLYSSHGMQDMLGELNRTMVSIRVELGKGQEKMESLIKRVDRIEQKIDKRHQ